METENLVNEKPRAAAKNEASFPVKKTEKSRIKELDFNKLAFGKQFADHMLVSDYKEGKWQNTRIIPYQSLTIDPSNMALHYGQSIFEGIKTNKNPQGEAMIFRPDKNWIRFNKSAQRLAMPEVPEEIFLGGMKQLISLDMQWIPSAENTSLYIRPFMFATDQFLGVRPSDTYRFMIITSPAGPYYNKPLKLYVEDKYTRAFPGGMGYAKAAGNYAGSLYPTERVKEMGYDQILWTDGVEHKYLQECGTMNLFVVIGDEVITPDLEEGTILDGVTRDSAIQLLKDWGIKVSARPISIDEVLEAEKRGALKELFGAGTAAGIAYVSEIGYGDQTINFDFDKWKIAPKLLKELNAIKNGETADPHDWLFKI